MVWTVFFMFKLLRLVLLCAMLYGAFQLGGIVQDRQALSEDIIRLHVVANSDSQEDQALKLQIRDAVVEDLTQVMASVDTVEEAKEFLGGYLEEIEAIAKRVIGEAGFSDDVTVTLTQETFDTREYDTFTLPAGVYDSLRIVIGQGEGHNWWCVVFPSLCKPVTTEEFEDTAAGAGFSDTLTETVSKEEGYEIRFWLLDLFGRVQNFFAGL